MRDVITLTLFTFAVITMVLVAVHTDMTGLAQLGVILVSLTSIYMEAQR